MREGGVAEPTDRIPTGETEQREAGAGADGVGRVVCVSLQGVPRLAHWT